jgi:cell pole-organizing protein PopZ
MSDAPKSANDPSMDDILASIRKIISDDEARAQVSGGQTAASGSANPAPAKRDDVLLLTDLVEDPKGGSRPTLLPLPRVDPASAGDMPQPTIGGDSGADQALVAAGVAGVASSALDRLSQAVQDSVPAPMAPDPGPTMGSGKTLEELVKEMLRPMLKEWLDKNLPPMVERFVEREIVRLTRR